MYIFQFQPIRTMEIFSIKKQIFENYLNNLNFSRYFKETNQTVTVVIYLTVETLYRIYVHLLMPDRILGFLLLHDSHK